MKKILIESQFLYQYDSSESGFTSGGTQRYALELGKLFVDMGWEVIIATKTSKPFKEQIDKTSTVFGLKAPYGNLGTPKFSKSVFELCLRENVDLACYSDIMVGYRHRHENSFAIQHGIAWDNPNRGMINKLYQWFYKNATLKYKKVICVDTNFINWMRMRSSEFFAKPERLIYIPNFADEQVFSYKYKDWSNCDVFPLLYPRRLVKHRGYNLFIEMCNRLIKKGYPIKPIIACEDFASERLHKEYPALNRKIYNIVHPKMNEIWDLYHESYLTFIPTLWSEGTSLSAIESISSGCPVIGSNVGGIPNVIMPHFNGLIVSPTIDDFASATEYLINNIHERNRMAKNCATMNRVFGIQRWREDITNAIHDLL